jgi:DNA-binding MarR family transcriptional regulator
LAVDDSEPPRDTVPPRRPTGAGFLLAQVGALGARLFAARLAPLGLTPPQSGLLRAIVRDPGRSQNALAEQLGVRPSRLVVLVDELEGAGLVERRAHATDRRQRAVHLTEQGRAAMGKLAAVAADHEDELCRALDAEDRRRLVDLLGRIAADHDLTPGVHPGYGSV